MDGVRFRLPLLPIGVTALGVALGWLEPEFWTKIWGGALLVWGTAGLCVEAWYFGRWVSSRSRGVNEYR